jgi:hypothetical protein
MRGIKMENYAVINTSITVDRFGYYYRRHALVKIDSYSTILKVLIFPPDSKEQEIVPDDIKLINDMLVGKNIKPLMTKLKEAVSLQEFEDDDSALLWFRLNYSENGFIRARNVFEK